MNYLILIGAAVFGFWIVSFLINQYPDQSGKVANNKPPAPPPGSVPDPVAWACQILQLSWPTDLLLLETAYQQRKRDFGPMRIGTLQGEARAAAEQQLREIEDAYSILRQFLSSAGAR